MESGIALINFPEAEWDCEKNNFITIENVWDGDWIYSTAGEKIKRSGRKKSFRKPEAIRLKRIGMKIHFLQAGYCLQRKNQMQRNVHSLHQNAFHR